MSGKHLRPAGQRPSRTGFGHPWLRWLTYRRHKSEKTRVQWAKTTTTTADYDWIKVIFNDEPPIWIRNGADAGTLVWCRSNKMCEDDYLKRTCKFTTITDMILMKLFLFHQLKGCLVSMWSLDVFSVSEWVFAVSQFHKYHKVNINLMDTFAIKKAKPTYIKTPSLQW